MKYSATHYRLVTPEQLQQGWMELRGVTPIHHNFIVIRQLDSGNYVVKVPDVEVREVEVIHASTRA